MSRHGEIREFIRENNYTVSTILKNEKNTNILVKIPKKFAFFLFFRPNIPEKKNNALF